MTTLKLTRSGEQRYTAHIDGGIVVIKKLPLQQRGSDGKSWVADFHQQQPQGWADPVRIASSLSFKMIKVLVRRWLEARA